jgi:hypothetical protein
MIVKDINIGIIEEHSGIFDTFDIDAIVGMSYNYDNKLNPNTLFEKLMD